MAAGADIIAGTLEKTASSPDIGRIAAIYDVEDGARLTCGACCVSNDDIRLESGMSAHAARMDIRRAQ